MQTYKCKSMSELSDNEIKNGCYVIQFLSFERAIQESFELNNIKSKSKGYRITDQGIEIIVD